ncbi:hypothetical protein UFOVP87_34 [uncultured Caudovirales phage]|uniref:Uncharacterized protein n=1 Tax=uncultured Caudovirales phage TaxID=2100421 RepID=A0A6J5KX44_9CAUD|nr:hypothetical protein UFOVP87_34 [uncultured Caudovirales phage]
MKQTVERLPRVHRDIYTAHYLEAKRNRVELMAWFEGRNIYNLFSKEFISGEDFARLRAFLRGNSRSFFSTVSEEPAYFDLGQQIQTLKGYTNLINTPTDFMLLKPKERNRIIDEQIALSKRLSLLNSKKVA